MLFRFSILRTVVPANYSFFAATRTVVTRLQMARERTMCFSMFRSILGGCPLLFRIIFLALDSRRIRATVDFEHTERKSRTTWVNVFPDCSWDRITFRISLDSIFYLSQGFCFEATNYCILFAEQWAIHLCRPRKSWSLCLNARERNSLLSKYLEHPILLVQRNTRFPTLSCASPWFHLIVSRIPSIWYAIIT